ncbi:hypothetical protein GCM10027589_07430 [Actinocorallia lasiicapitis]
MSDHRFAWRKVTLSAVTAIVAVAAAATAAQAAPQPRAPLTDAVLASGNYHSLLVKPNGTLWGWGSNFSGQLGTAGAGAKSSATLVPGISELSHYPRSVAAGERHSLAVKSDGTVWAWGDDSDGQLGNGLAGSTYVPTQVSGLSAVVAVAAGFESSYALKSDGTVWAWGANSYGQLGNGTTTLSQSPVQVSGITNARALSAGYGFAVVTLNDGTAKAWGSQDSGSLGNGAASGISTTPSTVFGLTGLRLDRDALASGSAHTLAVKTDGTLVSWGLNDDGQLGNGSTTDATSPVSVTGLTNVAKVGGGWVNSYAITSGGVVKSWGSGGSSPAGPLGNGTVVGATTPVTVSVVPTTTIGVSGGDSWAASVSPDGTVYSWGYDAVQALGNGAGGSTSTPAVVINTP